MIGRPDLHAGTPDRAAHADLLSEMLKAVRLTGSVFLSGRFTAPFDVTDPTSYGERVPMAHLRHVSILHLVVAGSCNFDTAGETRRVTAGELLFLPFPGRYRFWNGEPVHRSLAGDIVRP